MPGDFVNETEANAKKAYDAGVAARQAARSAKQVHMSAHSEHDAEEERVVWNGSRWVIPEEVSV